MENTNANGFDFAAYQKPFVDAATNATKQFWNLTTQNEGQQFFVKLYEQQMDWFKNQQNTSGWVSPDNMKSWYNIQVEFLKKYTELLGNSANLANLNQFYDKSFMPEHLNQVSEMMQQSWQKLQKSIKFGIFEPAAMDSLYNGEKFREAIGKLLGYNLFGNVQAPTKLVEDYFNNIVATLQTNTDEWSSLMKDAAAQGTPSASNLYGMNLIEQMSGMMNKSMSNAFAPMAKMFPVKERDEMVDAIRNVQYSYQSFLFKTNTLQMMVIDKGSAALPATIKKFSEAYKTKQTLPNYEEFFTGYINELENILIETLNTPAYSKVQSDMANALVTNKKQVEVLKELVFGGLPFVKYGEFDDLLLEISTLRKKNRQLENRLSALESKLEAMN